MSNGFEGTKASKGMSEQIMTFVKKAEIRQSLGGSLGAVWIWN